MKYRVALRTVIAPLPPANILVDSDIPRQALQAGEIGNNKSQVSGFRDYRIATITWALTKVTGMHMHIRNDRHPPGATFRPNCTELAAIEFDKAIRKAIRINIIIEQKMFDPPRRALNTPQQKAAALAVPVRPPPQLVDTFVPDPRAANQFRRVAERCTQQHWK
jgi:hypothetical protein